MNIEELAFKDRRTLVNLNEPDLLNIIEFLQIDRKQWINQFSKIHNESVEIQKENQKLKQQLDKYENEPLTNKISRIDSIVSNIYSQNKTQQKEFIKYLEDEIKQINPKILDDGELNLRLDDIKYTQYLIYKQILQKYKEIIGDDR